MGRLNQDDYLWSLAFQAAARSTCDRGRHGCVVAREGVVLATGYNGSAPGEPHCDEDGHLLIHHIPVNPANPEVGVLGESHCRDERGYQRRPGRRVAEGLRLVYHRRPLPAMLDGYLPPEAGGIVSAKRLRRSRRAELVVEASREVRHTVDFSR